MNIEEFKEYNKLVIEASREVSRPWKWATIILSLLLLCMVSIYFLCPSEVVVEQSNNNSIGSSNNNEG